MEKEWSKVSELVERNPSPLTMDRKAKLAIEKFLGESWIKDTVDHILGLKTEWNLASSCLRILESEYAADYAYSIYKKSMDKDDCRLAVGVIKDIAHPKSIEWIREFLEDETVADVGLGVLDQLLWCEKIEPSKKTEQLLDLAIEKWGGMNEKINFIREYLADRKRLSGE